MDSSDASGSKSAKKKSRLRNADSSPPYAGPESPAENPDEPGQSPGFRRTASTPSRRKAKPQPGDATLRRSASNAEANPPQTYYLKYTTKDAPHQVRFVPVDAAAAVQAAPPPRRRLRHLPTDGEDPDDAKSAIGDKCAGCMASLSSMATQTLRKSEGLLRSFCRVRRTAEEPKQRSGYNVKGLETILHEKEENEEPGELTKLPVDEEPNEEEEKKKKKKEKKKKDTRPLFIFSDRNYLVRAARMLIEWPPFEAVILLAIAANCIIMALEEYLPNKEMSPLSIELDKSEIYFLVIFSAECVIKILALGFVLHPGSYLRSMWNILDFVVVVTGLATFLLQDLGINLRILRAIRVLRPLKLVAGIPSLQVIMFSIFKAMIPLMQIGVLILFAILIFAIIGMEFYNGRFHKTCYLTDVDGNITEMLDPDDPRPCTISPDPPMGANVCPNGTKCVEAWDGPNYGITSFDNIGNSMLTVFVCITMEGWTDVLYWSNDALGNGANWLYFFSLVIVGSFFMLNLVLGIISGEFAKEREKVENRIHFFKMKIKNRMRHEYEWYQQWIGKGEEIEIKEFGLAEQNDRKKHDANSNAIHPADDPEGAVMNSNEAEADSRAMKIKRFRLKLRKLCKSQFWFWLVMTLVFLNLLCAMVRHAGMPRWLEEFLFIANLCFLAVFSLEIFIKLFAFGPRRYFDANFNIFDFVVIIASIVEVIIHHLFGTRLGLSALRAFRLLRLFKLTKYWKSMSNLTISLINSIRSIFSLLFLLFLFIFIFALLGMQLFGGKFFFEDGRPGANFDSIGVAMMSVFQILTGEDWNEIMYDGVRATGGANSIGMIYSLFFVVLTVFGNYTLLNVFLAIAVDNLANAQEMTEAENEEDEESHKAIEPPPEEEEEEEEVIDPKAMVPFSSLFIFSPENRLRKFAHSIVITFYFDAFIMLMILGSSIALALEDPINQHSKLNQVLVYLDYVFTGAFVSECILKIISMGFVAHRGSYIRDPWNVLDFIVVVGALLSYAIEATQSSGTNLNVIKTMRVLRVLRPLKTINRIPKLKSVVDCLIGSILNVVNILLVYLLFQIIFAVMAVQLMAGKFNYCNDEGQNSTLACVGNFTNEDNETFAREWVRYDFHYDNVANAWLTLFAISTGEGWPDIYQHSRDATEPGLAPEPGNWKTIAIFYVTYFVVFPFFFINMFVAFIIITFQEQEEAALKSDDEDAFDKNQKSCVDFVINAKPVAQFVPEDEFSMQYDIWKKVNSTEFEVFIMVVICLNTIIMMLKIYKPPYDYAMVLKVLNWIFTGIFVIEAALKLFAFKIKHYFGDSWNTFDFITVVGSIADILVTEFGKGMISVGFLRLFRAARLIKLLRKGEGVKTLLWTFIQSFKSLPYVCLLIFMLFFVYAIVGMQILGNLAIDVPGSAINRHNNFSSFLLSFLLLFRCSTGEAWQEIMMSCVSAKCHPNIDNAENMTCGSPFAYAYFVSFIFLCMFLMLNLFVAVIMDNFDYLTRDSSILGAHQLDSFVREWGELDPSASGLIHHDKVFEMMRRLSPPLGFGRVCPLKLAYKKMISMNVPLDEEHRMHFTTTLFALVRRNLNIKTVSEEDLEEEDLDVRETSRRIVELTKEADEELRQMLLHSWPQTVKFMEVLVPSEDDTGPGKLTTGKYYAARTILDNWKTYKGYDKKSGAELLKKLF